MPHPNLRLRGGAYSWRRKITIGRTAIPLCLSLRTGNLHQARAIAARLEVTLEDLRMGFNEKPVAIGQATLKQIFSHAMRRQLERVLTDQRPSAVPAEHHALANRLYAALWRLHYSQGAAIVLDEPQEQRLLTDGWTPDEVKLLHTLCQRANAGETIIRKAQIEDYLERFAIAPTSGNIGRIKQVIYSARAAACDEATKRLKDQSGEFTDWVEAALEDDSPIYDVAATAPEPAQSPAPTPQPSPPPAAETERTRIPSPTSDRPSLLLVEAAELCIQAYIAADAWDEDSVKQVRTAIRMFDFAAGQNATVETLHQEHVVEFEKLCARLPNRWGRTREELAGGIAASLKRAEKMDPTMVGISRPTVRKHVTWITKVLDFAASDRGDKHRTAEALSFKEVRKGLGKGGKKERARDKRAGCTHAELSRLLEAPIWSGSASLDDRFNAGRYVWQDAWYWLPLMFILYGGRSAELVALPLADVHEKAAIPNFRVDYSDLRRIKNIQSVRSLPVHPELIRLGFLDYVERIRALGHELLFPEMHSPDSQSFASTFYKSIFQHWRNWAFPNGTSWKHQIGGVMKDKDVHSFRGTATSLLKGKVEDSVRFDILGHEGGNTTTSVYDEEAALEDKLVALKLLSPLTASIKVLPLRLRPQERMKFGSRRGRR